MTSRALENIPSAFPPRRFSDPVSPLNDGIHDETRMLLSAVELVDKLGLKIISVDAAARATNASWCRTAASATRSKAWRWRARIAPAIGPPRATAWKSAG